ncbi:hypothetical protein [Urechidicola croceus]|uniref:Uncharacterized protein n=1 Tax=Urechidicola croceus TaxID=1850246 RepID=A0A1D8PAW2_9FLAO|nr:hypothetical protein [Urechidicola croceus]AOW21723.1 hypothetical protein LPB138_13985 [Urechidicola croceus]
MNKLMPVDVLSSIKGAKPSEDVNKLFEVIKGANPNTSLTNNNTAVSLSQLREDIVIESSEVVKVIIKENFPLEKEGYLVVSQVIED